MALRIRDYQHLVLGRAAGPMLGVVGFDLLPEALGQEPASWVHVPASLGTFVAAFLVLHLVRALDGDPPPG